MCLKRDTGIKRFLRMDEDTYSLDDIHTIGDLLEQAGRGIDKSCVSEGINVIFETERGKFYCGSVELVITDAPPELVHDYLEELGEEGGDSEGTD